MIARLEQPNHLSSVAKYMSVKEGIRLMIVFRLMGAFKGTCIDKMAEWKSRIQHILVSLVGGKDEAVEIFQLVPRLPSPMLRRPVKAESHRITGGSMMSLSISHCFILGGRRTHGTVARVCAPTPIGYVALMPSTTLMHLNVIHS
jgi:hypothetical protein